MLGGANVPFCLGQVFRQGDVPAGGSILGSVIGDTVTIQATVKNRWPDGSVKFAVLAGRANLAANVPLVVRLAAGSATASGSALTLVDLRLANIVCTIEASGFGSANWSGTDWDSPFIEWISGPKMSSWIYRKPVGSDAHLVAWLEVRLFQGGAIQVLPWVENGYLNVPGPTNRSATYSFTLGGTRRYSGAFDLKHHQRTPLLGGAALSYWLTTDPAVTVQHDALYLMSTELVPSYYRGGSQLAAVVSAHPSTYTPLAQGAFTYSDDSMPSPGYQEPIGLLPLHDVIYLASDDPRAYSIVIRGGYSAGRYGTHYRDESTNRPILPQSYPNTCIRSGQGFYASGGSTRGIYTPASSGGNPPTWDMAHCPSVGFLSYLVSGSWYFLEESQFAAAFNYLCVSDLAVQRNGALGLVQADPNSVGVRDSAWAWRTLTQALCITPESDIAHSAALKTLVQNNVDHFHARYVAQANCPLGYTQAGTTAYDGTLSTVAPWQQDFLTAAWGWSISMVLPLSSGHLAKLQAFFSWTAKSAVHRLGTAPNGWAYQNATAYTAKVSSPNQFPNWNTGTGPWYLEDQAYSATYTPRPTWLGSTSENVLAGEDLPGAPGSAVRSFWGNLQPAISYAVRHGVPGALAGYNRMIGARNWSSLRSAFYTRPTWAIKPLRVMPAWMMSRPLNTWFAISGTAGAGGSAIDAFSGMALRDETGEIFIAAAGGHLNSSDNRVVALGLHQDAPNWEQRSTSSSSFERDVAYYADGKPSSRHTYHTTHWLPSLGRVMLMGARFVYGTAVEFKTVDGFDPATNIWDARGTYADLPLGAGYGTVVDGRGFVWTNQHRRWNPSTKEWTNPITSRAANFVRWPYAYDPARDQIFGLCYADGEGFGPAVVNAVRVPAEGAASYQVTFNPSTALAQFLADAPAYSGMDYDPANDRYLFYCGQGAGAGRIYVITPNNTNVWDMSLFNLASGSLTPPDPGPGGVNNRFRYVPSLGGFVLVANGSSDLYFLRTA